MTIHVNIIKSDPIFFQNIFVAFTHTNRGIGLILFLVLHDGFYLLVLPQIITVFLGFGHFFLLVSLC